METGLENCLGHGIPRTLYSFEIVKMAQKQDWMRSAFAATPDSEPPTESQRIILKNISQAIISSQTFNSALAFLNLSRPIQSLTVQAEEYLRPFIDQLLSETDKVDFQHFLRRRDAFELFITQIEDGMNQQADLKHESKANPDE